MQRIDGIDCGAEESYDPVASSTRVSHQTVLCAVV